MKEMRACCVCGTLHPVEKLTEFDDSYLCESCLHTETIRCQRCGERIWTDDNAGDGNTPLCQSCYDRYYTTCEDCGRVIHQEDADWLWIAAGALVLLGAAVLCHKLRGKRKKK